MQLVESKTFFFVNNKEPGRRAAKKTSLNLLRSRATPRAQFNKSFLLLFFKKEALSFFALS